MAKWYPFTGDPCVDNLQGMPDFVSKHDIRVWKFFQKITGGEKDDCWFWTGSHNSANGRPQVNWKGHTTPAARVLLEILFGHSLSNDLFACHTCDNGLCMNPFHLFAGTAKENFEDMRRKGRYVHDREHR